MQLCGWGLENVDLWCRQVEEGVKVRHGIPFAVKQELNLARQNLYWIWVDPKPTLPETEVLNLDPTEVGPPAPDPTFTPIGHVSLDWEDYGGEAELADRARGICTVATFFILVSMQGGGLGK